MCLIVGRALFVNKIRILFQKKKTINLKPIPYEPVLIWKKIGSRIRLARHFAELISDIFLSVDRGHDSRYEIWNQAVCLLCQCVISEFTKVEDYEIENKTRQHWIRMRENGGSLDFNFILLLNPAVDENWVYQHRLLFQSILTFSVTNKFTEHCHIFCAQIEYFCLLTL